MKKSVGKLLFSDLSRIDDSLFGWVKHLFNHREELVNKLPYDRKFFGQMILSGICETYPRICSDPNCKMTKCVLSVALKKSYNDKDLKNALISLKKVKIKNDSNKIYQSFYGLLINHEIAKYLFETYKLHMDGNQLLHKSHYTEFIKHLIESCDFSNKLEINYPYLKLRYTFYGITYFSVMKWRPIYASVFMVLRALSTLDEIMKERPIQGFYSLHIRMMYTTVVDFFDRLSKLNQNFEGKEWLRNQRFDVKDELEKENIRKELISQMAEILVPLREFYRILGKKYKEYEDDLNGFRTKKIGLFCNYCLEVLLKEEEARLCSFCKTASYCSEDCELGDIWRHQQKCSFYLDYKVFREPLKVCKICTERKEQAFLCSRCKRGYYCSKKCQLKDWEDGHKKECRKLAKLLRKSEKK